MSAVDETVRLKYLSEEPEFHCPPLSSMIERLLGLFLKKHPVLLSIIGCGAALYLFLKDSNPWTLGLVAAAFGSIFVALKYKLDQASYHKDLYDRRFVVYKIIEAVMCEWASSGTASRDLVTKLDNIMRPSFFLFSDITYQFIKQFRYSIIVLAFMLPPPPGKDDQERVLKARNFLIRLVDRENLPINFPELKIDSY